MLEFVILIGIVSALIFTIMSVGMTDTTDTTGENNDKVPLAKYGEKANNWYNEFGFKYDATTSPDDAHKNTINYDTSGENNNTHYSLLNMAVEILPPYMGNLGNDDIKYVQDETGSQGPPGADAIDGTDGIDAIDGTDGIDGINGLDGTNGADGTGGGGGADKFKKYFGNGTFIYAPHNNGNIATQGYASATGNQANDGSKVYAHGTGHIFEDGMPVNDSTNSQGNYSINAENLAGHVTNNIQGSESQEKISTDPLIYGPNQKSTIPFKKDTSDSK